MFLYGIDGGVPVDGIDPIIKSMDKSFPETFVNLGYNCLLDSVNGSTVDWSVRPNMIFAVALPYSPLTRMQKRAVVDIVTKELLTPKGLRSLSPKSEDISPVLCANMNVIWLITKVLLGRGC